MTLLLLLLLLPPLLPASMLNQSDDSMANMQVNNRPLKVGHTLTITGIPKTGDGRFESNILSGSDRAFHMSVRFRGTEGISTESEVVYNTFQAGSWGAEVRQGGFPFKHNELFKFTITLTREEFLVILSDGSEVHFPNRLGASEYKDFSFEKGVLIRSFEIN
ncbi:beta-galactoside-binding lectin isoform X3 [Gadus morhua]|uniref:beta-galactoside-binding lectin isoform X3 n=1 Tax=Gadus morhua TaxID=8049 RepID=UPI0011B58310|nr:beta-galactoside-binding lectin-like isoform X3 [Gadus morhua]